MYGKEKLIERGEVRRPEKHQALALSEPGGQDVIGMLIGATDSHLSLLTSGSFGRGKWAPELLEYGFLCV